MKITLGPAAEQAQGILGDEEYVRAIFEQSQG